MEFNEKLQELRKSKGMTQEELAEALYVSRTAVSKWESGRGYPSLDSLREISNYFSVTIDDLLSGEALLSIAEKDHKSKLRKIYDLLIGIADLLSFLMIVLPLYPKSIDGYIYSVNLVKFAEDSPWILSSYWILFIVLIAVGAIRILLDENKIQKHRKKLSYISVGVSILAVILLVLSRKAYAAALAFLLLVIKGMLLLRYVQTDARKD
ncbi:MAG: helix-turn-helix transcriptional regulator [Firmicutes bacterium]|nr:helix-turn-helix transcriptional regulator [Bacillota bacterium]